MAIDKFLDLKHDFDEDIVNHFSAFLMAADLNTKIRHVVLGDKTQRKLIKVEVSKPHVKHLTNIDLVIIVNHEVFELLEDDDKQILVHGALNGLHYDVEKDVLKNSGSAIESNTAKKFGIDNIIRVNELVTLTYKQQKEKNK